jgi:hypothetical protein
LFLVQEGVAEVGRPPHFLVEAIQHFGKYHERLNAGIPGFIGGCIDQRLSAEIAVFSHPPCGFHDVERVGGGD